MNQTNTSTPVEVVQSWLVAKLAEQLSLNPEAIDIGEPLTRYGLDSIDAVTLVGELEDWLEVELPSTLFWDYSTIAKSADYLVKEFDISAALTDAQASDVENAAPTRDEPEKASAKGWGGFWGKISGS